MKKAAIYARKSKLTEKGDSIDNQIKLCIGYLANIGIDDYVIYKDEGFSGKNTDRPKFLEMLEGAREKKFDLLICYKLDRISRNVADFSTLVSELELLGISFISVNEQFDTSNAMGRAMMLICSVFSQLERETISVRVRDNMYALAEKGNWLGGEVPMGFKSERVSFTDEGGKERSYCILLPVEDELKLIQKVYSLYLELGSLSKVEKYLLTNNIKTRRGKDWSKNTLSYILSNPAYVKANDSVIKYFKNKGLSVRGTPNGINGILIYNKKIGKNGGYRNVEDWLYVVSHHEGIIDSKKWLSAQKQLATNRSKAPNIGTSHSALLSGLIRCAKCESYMRVAYGQFNAEIGKKRFYYMCSLKHNSGKTRCANRNINGLDLDAAVIEKLKELSINKDLLIKYVETYKQNLLNSDVNKEIQAISNSITQNKSMINNLITNVSMTSDQNTAKIFMDRVTELTNENTRLQEKLTIQKEQLNKEENKTINYDNLIAKLKHITEFVDNCNIEEKRKLISSVVNKVFADGDTGTITLQLKG